jgi:hypothetical protein
MTAPSSVVRMSAWRSSFCAEAGQQCGQNACEIAFGPVGLAL